MTSRDCRSHPAEQTQDSEYRPRGTKPPPPSIKVNAHLRWDGLNRRVHAQIVCSHANDGSLGLGHSEWLRSDVDVVCAPRSSAHSRSKSGFGCAEAMTTSIGSSADGRRPFARPRMSVAATRGPVRDMHVASDASRGLTPFFFRCACQESPSSAVPRFALDSLDEPAVSAGQAVPCSGSGWQGSPQTSREEVRCGC
jgi:hypothetical protein